MLKVELLPAAHGDAILVQYGAKTSPRQILVDGGPHSTYPALRERILALPAAKRRFELVIVSHVDTDHIDGILCLLQDEELGVKIGDLWFNGQRHLAPRAQLGGLQGEFMEVLIEDRELPWNRKFHGKAVVIPPSGDLPTVKLPGGATVTLLSPTDKQLKKLENEWINAVKAAGFVPGNRDSARKQLARRKEYAPSAATLGGQVDASAANGSSIAVLFEFKDKALLLAADAFAEVLEESLARLAKKRGQEAIAVDAFKLAHHGSFSNISPRLLRLAPATHYLVSTNGDKFHHPDPPAIQLLLKERKGSQPHLVFNYESPSTQPWKDPSGQESHKYSSSFDGELQLAT